ncbi:MAG: hypothetical protein RIC57_03435 [Balneola sp.]
MSKKPSKEEWNALGNDIGLYSSVYLLIDGIPFTIKEERTKQKIVVSFYICGWFYGVWLNDHFFTKYLREVRKCFHTKKDLDKWYKIRKSHYGKKQADEWKEGTYYTYRTPYFPSLKSFQRHITKVAETISIIEYKEYEESSKNYKKANPEYFRNKNEEAEK